MSRFDFSFDEEESVKAAEWVNKHRKECPAPLGAIGGRMKYIFCPTSIGEVHRIECSCGAEIDVTNYDDW